MKNESIFTNDAGTDPHPIPHHPKKITQNGS
jgi:hypothetical protein